MPSATTKRPSVVENIKVLQIGDFGVRVDEKNWFNTNAPLTPAHFQVGVGYKVSVSVAKSGKKYINEILGVEDAAPATEAPATSTATAPVTDSVKAAEEALAKAKAEAAAKAAAAQVAETAKTTTGKHPSRAGYDKPLTEYDLAKDKQIARSGIIQAALQSPGIVQWSTNLDEYMLNVKKVADFALKYAQE